jgi:hypothetical protein
MVLRISAALALNADCEATNWGMFASRRLITLPFSSAPYDFDVRLMSG